MANYRVGKAEDIVKPGDIVQVKVLSVDPDAKRMSLSIKAALPEDEQAEAPAEADAVVENAAEATPVEETSEAPAAETASEEN